MSRRQPGRRSNPDHSYSFVDIKEEVTVGFPIQRMRRLRKNETIRRMVRETSVSMNDFIYPMFVVHGSGIKSEINSLPGNYHLSIDALIEEAKQVRDLGIPAILLFGLPEKKDENASEAYAPDGIVQSAVRAIKKEVPDLVVITDVCLCEYTHHGHCGIIKDGYVHNDATLELIAGPHKCVKITAPFG